MRERLVAAFVGLTVVVVALYGIPRAYVLADLVREKEQVRVDRTAELVAAAVTERRASGRPVDTEYLDTLAGAGEGLALHLPEGEVVDTSDWSEPAGADITSSADLDGGGAVTATRDGDEVREEVAEALLPLVLLGLLLALLSGLAGYLLARRIARPFQDLAAAARGLGAGRLDVDLPPYRVPEAREIATALASSGEKLGALLQHQRDVAVHASHELRTPVAALRLELEDLALWPETPGAVAAQLQRSVGELDRLERAIGQLLSTSQDLSASDEIDLDLDGLISDTVAGLEAAGRTVRHTPAGPLPTRLDPGPMVQALRLLLVDGSAVGAADRGSHLEIAITLPSAAPDDGGTEAADLVAAAGGGLTRTGYVVLLRVPKRRLTGS